MALRRIRLSAYHDHERSTAHADAFKVYLPPEALATRHRASEPQRLELTLPDRRVFTMRLPDGATAAEPLLVHAPRITEPALSRLARLPLPLWLACHACPTPALVLIWALVGANYAVFASSTLYHARAASLLAHAVLALQLVSFAQCMAIHPGAPPAGYLPTGEGSASAACKRTGLPLPPRAAWVRAANEVVLGLDHYCYWIARPIGLRNRKFFILFLLYSCALCLVGAAVAAHEVAALCAHGDAVLEQLRSPTASRALIEAAPVGSAARAKLKLASFALIVASDSPLRLFEAALPLLVPLILAEGRFSVARVLCVPLCLAADVLAGALLGAFGGWHLWLAARGRTTLARSDATYDIGWRANMEQVFGARRWAWALPLALGGPSVDGLSYPLNPAVARRQASHDLGLPDDVGLNA